MPHGIVPQNVPECEGPRRVTTPQTLTRDLRGSLLQRGVGRGLTVGDFFDALLRLGVRLDDPLGSIEVGVAQMSTGVIVKDNGPDGLEIREVR